MCGPPVHYNALKLRVHAAVCVGHVARDRYTAHEWSQKTSVGIGALVLLRGRVQRAPVTLKIGCWVMLKANMDKSRGFVNGSRGRVVAFSSDAEWKGAKVGKLGGQRLLPVVAFSIRTASETRVVKVRSRCDFTLVGRAEGPVCHLLAVSGPACF